MKKKYKIYEITRPQLLSNDNQVESHLLIPVSWANNCYTNIEDAEEHLEQHYEVYTRYTILPFYIG
jgi:hypothetical protein